MNSYIIANFTQSYFVAIIAALYRRCGFHKTVIIPLVRIIVHIIAMAIASREIKIMNNYHKVIIIKVDIYFWLLRN